MNLVIVESPAKCSKIQGYLGAGYKVIATMGHIRALQESLEATGLYKDFDPIYEFMSSKAKALKQLKDSAKEATRIFLAVDDDREGEAIAYSVCVFLKLNPTTTPRIVFHEITEKAIKAAVATPRLLDMRKVEAQQARSILDMLIGFTISPLLWRHVTSGLSAGRCQTPALRIVVEREEQIAAFSAATSWKVSGSWATLDATPIFGSLDDELEDEESALNYLEMLQDPRAATITKNAVKPWSASPPQPLITSTLQQQASALYSIPPKSTMSSAQKLYEAGHITYMRTDKANMSEEAKVSIREFVTKTYGEKYCGPLIALAAKSQEKSAVKSQEAHECIRPTHTEVVNLPGEWTASDKKIYALIWQRAVQSQMAPATGETCTINYIADADTDGAFQWTTITKRTLFEGWQIIGKVADLDDADNTETPMETAWSKIIALKPGQKLTWSQLKAEPFESKAPARFTEATLVRELEKHGIGRPSTFASLIATIQDKSYAEIKTIPGKPVTIRNYTINTDTVWPPTHTLITKKIGAEKQKLVPTDLGKTALKFTLQHFEDLFAYKFTAQMEQRLDKVADGEEPWKQVLKDVWASYKERYDALMKTRAASGATAKIREFGDGLKAVISKKGPLILRENSIDKSAPPTFYGWPAGLAFQDITEEAVKAFVAAAQTSLGTWRGHSIIKKTGKFGSYVQAGDTIASIEETDTVEQIGEKLTAKADKPAATPLKTFKEYEIYNGQYGPYIIKPALKQRKFVGVPKGVKIETLTEAEVDAIYKAYKPNKFASKKSNA